MKNNNEKILKELIRARLSNRASFAAFKRKMAKKYGIPTPGNLELLKAYHDFKAKGSFKKSRKIEKFLLTRPIRSLSGIVNVSVLTKAWPCPGKCIYCPKESGLPKSYLSGEPAVERAKSAKFDPFKQVAGRLDNLKNQGHPTDKVEVRIVGATWSCYPQKYQAWFIKRCFDACNKKDSKNLLAAQKLNEKAKHRIVGLSVETRPDFIDKKEIKRLRELGITLVELGIQSIRDDVLKKNLRGHGRAQIILATKLLKDAGFKVLYQMMPNLLGSNVKKDEAMFYELFTNPDFQPDLLKIYPCALLKETPLYKLWKAKKYRPYTEQQLINLLKDIKKEIPYYVRIQRIARDIPSDKIVAGPAKLSNIRQVLATLAKKEGWHCRCIRCREIKGDYNSKEKMFLLKINYKASGGLEIFLSFENKNRTRLYSLLRLRLPEKNKEGILPLLNNAALIREIHTYGKLVELGEKKVAAQHQGFGKKLIKEAEQIAAKNGYKKIAVISAIGTRPYFKKLGYALKDTYMVKEL